MSAPGTAGRADGAAAAVHPGSIHLQDTLISHDAPGTLSWNDAVAHVRAAGSDARLPTHDEVRKHIADHGKQPLFAKDVWWPVSDAPNAWVSVGNYDPSVRLGNRHECLGGPPGWGTTNDHADFRTSMGIMVRAAFALTASETSGTMSWTDAMAHARAAVIGARLPTHDEVRQHIADHDKQALFDKDVWWPVSDAPNAWVSVGNYDSSVRLGNRHDALFGPPAWGTTNDHADFRTSMGIMVPAAFALTTSDASGTMSWAEAAAHAKAIGNGARLPTHDEVRKHIADHGHGSLCDKDMWWPISDAPNAWVSVGNYDTPVRLGNRHDALFGPPGWGTTNQFADFRTSMGIMAHVINNIQVVHTLTITDASGILSWNDSVVFARAGGNGARLPTHAEVRKYIADHGHGPLFQKDVWWPVSDAPNTWVSVGNYDTHVRLGNRHDTLFGPPGWGTTNQFADFRTSMGIMVLTHTVPCTFIFHFHACDRIRKRLIRC